MRVPTSRSTGKSSARWSSTSTTLRSRENTMDSNTIKEIANQLGVGTDYLLNHLSEFASKWAAMQITRNSIVCVFLVITLIITVRVLVWAIHSADDEYSSFVLIAIIDAIVVIFLFIAIAFSAANIMAYAVSPEAAMVNNMLAMH
nr:MAG TPA: helix-turn-helix domain protein [Caudoviricetes sp.]